VNDVDPFCPDFFGIGFFLDFLGIRNLIKKFLTDIFDGRILIKKSRKISPY